MRLWDKSAPSDELDEAGRALAQALHRFTARDDWQLDARLLPHDLKASKAHVRGLGRVGALPDEEVARIVAGLESIEADLERGAFRIAEELEDGHTAIEAALVERIGESGKRVHLGRSRNDQVLAALRLYQRAALDRLARSTVAAGRALLDLARAHLRVVMPGYTHLQRAVPQTFAHWAAAHAEGFAEAAASVCGTARQLCSASPLGAAAGYGVNLPLDRDGVARDLELDALQVNPLWSQTSRGITEAVVLTAAWHGVAVLRRLAWDLSLFTTGEFAFVRLSDPFTTGSSIMPNKRNPDVVELMRASASVVQGALVEVMSIVSLSSGYHRDLQLTKGPTMRALDEAESAISLVPALVQGIQVDAERMQAAVTRDTLATDAAVTLARDGMPFRDAYRRVGTELAGAAEQPAGLAAALASVAARVSPGAPGNLLLERIEARFAALERSFAGA